MRPRSAWGLGAVTLAATPALAATASFTTVGSWPTGYVATMTVHNDTSTTMTSWRVEFDLPSGTTITGFWSANLARTGAHHVFTNKPWNGTLGPGASTSFGWVATGGGVPANCTVNGAPCTGGGDIQPPSTPTNLRLGSVSGQTSLLWNASTDNVGVDHYDVTLNGTALGSTSSLRIPVTISGPGTYSFGVRAVDAAGNASVPANLTFVIDPPPPTPRPTATP